MADQVSDGKNSPPAPNAVAEHDGIVWLVSTAPVEYLPAVAFMEQRADAIARGAAPETVWLLAHPPLYTAGTSARDDELLDAQRFPVFRTGRGGRFTYHGPGQRIAYVMLDLRRRQSDVRCFVQRLEAWMIAAVGEFGIAARRSPGNVGVWVDDASGIAKIAAVGVRVRRWITFHGVALNVSPDLSHYAGIIPCGLAQYPVTSLARLGVRTTLSEVDAVLRRTFTDALRS